MEGVVSYNNACIRGFLIVTKYTGFFPDSRLPIPDSRFPTPDSLLPTPYSLVFSSFVVRD
ncbi:MAG: hypothetical protein F6K56_12380 [Moorea sp. SIO3G5]|nr:hypothetical protein [Moorena sp. SIO3G5]